jgi:hypothetical protein
MKYFIYITCIFFFSCSEEKSKVNKNLIYFDSQFISELGDDNYYKFEKVLNSKMSVQYLDKIIYVSKVVDLNSCGVYSGDFEIKNDSIYLIYKLESDEVCTSTSIERLIYIIKNPESKNFHFKLLSK